MNNKRVFIAVFSKIIGTVTIGYIAGSYFSLSAFMISGIRSNCSLSNIYSLMNIISKRWFYYIWTFESFAATLFLSAYILSKPCFSHPYLLYSGLGTASLIPISFFYIQPRTTKIMQQIEEKNTITSENTFKNWSRYYLINTIFSSIIFVMTVVGSYGDTLSA
ncbi:hypothetical protein PCANB_001728 [Pneumocystis canis]|nr:hypothetical protein PCANB_001728 [Pneumocystis canis]